MARAASSATGTRGGWWAPRMWSYPATDAAALVPDPALPAQVYHLWHNSRAIAPERALALAVLVQAVQDVHRYRASGLAHHRPLHDRALEWIDSPDREWGFSFANLCDAFALDADQVRAALRPPPAGTSRQAA